MSKKPETNESRPTCGLAVASCSAGPAEEYIRRNIAIAKACGLKAEVGLMLLRMQNRRRAPKWLLASLAAIEERAKDLPGELVQWRDAAPDNPYLPNKQV